LKLLLAICGISIIFILWVFTLNRSRSSYSNDVWVFSDKIAEQIIEIDVGEVASGGFWNGKRHIVNRTVKQLTQPQQFYGCACVRFELESGRIRPSQVGSLEITFNVPDFAGPFSIKRTGIVNEQKQLLSVKIFGTAKNPYLRSLSQRNPIILDSRNLRTIVPLDGPRKIAIDHANSKLPGWLSVHLDNDGGVDNLILTATSECRSFIGLNELVLSFREVGSLVSSQLRVPIRIPPLVEFFPSTAELGRSVKKQRVRILATNASFLPGRLRLESSEPFISAQIITQEKRTAEIEIALGREFAASYSFARVRVMQDDDYLGCLSVIVSGDL